MNLKIFVVISVLSGHLFYNINANKNSTVKPHIIFILVDDLVI